MSVAERLRARIEREGPLTFADFMNAALYDVDGYYGARSPQGFAGDYLTAPETTPLFGATLSRLASAVWKALDEPEDFEVVDVGAGTGALLRDLAQTLAQEDPDAAQAARYAAIEVSAAADRAQAKTLAGIPIVRARSLSALGPVNGLVIANELLDALPFHLVTRRGGALRELRVGVADGAFAFVESDPSDSRLAKEAVDVAEEERVSVPLAAYDWFATLAAALERGLALVIDYPTSARADVRTYFRHTTGAGPLERVGQQDVTAALDFDRLALHAERAGLEVLDRRTQADLLAELGFDERVREIADPGARDPLGQVRAASARNAARSVVDPGGMGAFSTLLLGKRMRLTTLSM
jgi:SAM-dependent MidA family methyltransferase